LDQALFEYVEISVLKKSPQGTAYPQGDSHSDEPSPSRPCFACQSL
jgi:hypothetical protein